VTIPSSRRRDVGEMYPIREWLKVDCLTAVEPSIAKYSPKVSFSRVRIRNQWRNHNYYHINALERIACSNVSYYDTTYLYTKSIEVGLHEDGGCDL